MSWPQKSSSRLQSDTRHSLINIRVSVVMSNPTNKMFHLPTTRYTNIYTARNSAHHLLARRCSNPRHIVCARPDNDDHSQAKTRRRLSMCEQRAMIVIWRRAFCYDSFDDWVIALILVRPHNCYTNNNHTHGHTATHTHAVSIYLGAPFESANLRIYEFTQTNKTTGWTRWLQINNKNIVLMRGLGKRKGQQRRCSGNALWFRHCFLPPRLRHRNNNKKTRPLYAKQTQSLHTHKNRSHTHCGAQIKSTFAIYRRWQHRGVTTPHHRHDVFDVVRFNDIFVCVWTYSSCMRFTRKCGQHTLRPFVQLCFRNLIWFAMYRTMFSRYRTMGDAAMLIWVSRKSMKSFRTKNMTVWLGN